jgi:PPOX class probable F420-dependent enzyme
VPALDDDTCRRRLTAADHGVLATVGSDGAPHAVPVSFVVVDGIVVSPVDDVKAKSTTSLQRVRNVEARGRAALLVEEWHREDWSQLWWVRADLSTAALEDDDAAERADAALRAKYPQYRDARFADLLVLAIDRLVGWAAATVS